MNCSDEVTIVKINRFLDILRKEENGASTLQSTVAAFWDQRLLQA